MRKSIITFVSIILLLFPCGVYSEEELKKDGLSPSEMEAVRQLKEGTSTMLLKKYEEAVECFEKAIELNSELTEAHYNLAISYVELEKYKKSVKALNRVLQLDPDHANAYYALGYSYYKLKKYDDAVDAFKHAVELKPDNAFAHSKLGLVYTVMGKKEAAMEHHRILKTLNSKLADELYREIGKVKK